MRRVFLVLTAIMITMPAHALDCADAGTQAEMNACAGQEYKRSDQELNRAYGEVMARLGDDAEAKALLRKAQRAWISFRDAQCDFAASSGKGGSIHPMLVAGCLADLTKKRTEELRSALVCEEGDLSCP